MRANPNPYPYPYPVPGSPLLRGRLVTGSPEANT